ncbi:hypothetical protein B1A99_29200 [Cohnella sp. CIP 111063]|uniref:glycoside hydrolase family 38 N-terminal domain-containing protein n=1 Tax=unclassified Cohnella TaxID=2636738 RepID=UPI000B8C6335|nr:MULTISPECIES: glycosyl hydrolase-related protein [unclassified Cohnella]OXS53731.1 hypothetical protein B1A99_29200 [Cohnella sp. CIP 111063]PRX62017.1 alpha-mannosidase [Cohnella sp. SGD-V74]
MNKKTYHFIAHTHWDREWYLTFEQFRYRLVHLIDKLLDLLDRDPEFKSFHLDGQTIVLEDYYALRPGQRERLEHYIREGRILIGPWYEQNDLYLTSAESTLRNLIEGIRTARQLGGEMKVGYLPDHFGLIGQMPQIFNDIGIDNCVFGRGYDVQKHGSPCFHWQSPDGSEVTGLLLYHWYNSAQRLPSDADQLKSVFDVIRRREEAVNPTPHYPMMNGVDHLEAQEDLPEVLEQLRRLYGEEIEVVHTTLPSYVQHVQAYMDSQPEGTYPVVAGELREAFEYSILAGTLSSRIYVKQANVHVHDLIEKWLEPLSVWCAMLDLDACDTETIRYVWKQYMANHPHDSICGCSQDAVHDQMMDRYQRVKELAEEVIDRKLTVLARQVSGQLFGETDQKLLVVNSSQLAASSVVATAVYFLEEDDVQSFSIEDEQGQSIPYRIVSERPSRIPVLSPINLPGMMAVRRYDIEWQPRVPALGYATYRIRQHQIGNQVRDAVDFSTMALENRLLRVEIQPNGTFHIFNKRTGVWLRNQGQIQESGDCGDLYVYKEVADETHSVWNDPVEIEAMIANELYQECAYRFTWHLPASLDHTRKSRLADKVPCSFRVTLRLDADAAQVNLKVEMDNQAKDHRVRLLFPGPSQALHVLAGGQLDVVKRSWDSGREWERDANSQAFWEWFAPVYASGGTAIFAKGLHDYEMLDEGKTAAVTLLRGVETIYLREEVYAEIDVQPKAQCPGRQIVELAVRPFSDESATTLYQEAERYHQGVRTKLSPIDQDKWNKGRTWVQDTQHSGLFKLLDPNAHKPALPASGSIIQLEGDVMISALKWAEDGQAPVVRLYNVEESAVQVKLSAPGLSDEATKTNLLEEPLETIAVRDDTLVTELAAKKFATYRL